MVWGGVPLAFESPDTSQGCEKPTYQALKYPGIQTRSPQPHFFQVVPDSYKYALSSKRRTVQV